MPLGGLMPDKILTRNFLGKSKFFSAFSETDLSRFLQEFSVKIYRKNTTLFLRGDEADNLYVILSGWVKLHRETPEGEDAIVSLLTRGDVFDKTVLFANNRYPLSSVTLSDVSVAEIPVNVVREVATSNIEIMKNLLAIMSDEIYDLQMENEHLSIMSAPQRVGCLILKLAHQNEDNGYEAVLPYDKSLAAAKLGMKPETFSRSLAHLRKIGVVSKGSKIKISNIEELSSFCCRHCSSVLEDFENGKTLCNDDICCSKKCDNKSRCSNM